MKDWTNYQESTYNDKVSNLLVDFLDKYSVNRCIDLGCGSGNETVYMVHHGLNVLAVARQLNEAYILNRLNDEEKNKVSFLETSFENIELPMTQLITSFFSIPFCNPDYFNDLWNEIYDSLEDNGYFVGQLFGDRDDFKDYPLVNTFTIDEVRELLKNYNIIKLEEVEYVRKIDNKKWHFFDIIAKKEKDIWIDEIKNI